MPDTAAGGVPGAGACAVALDGPGQEVAAGLACADPLRPASRPGGVAIIDGGLATHIEALGEDIDHALWSARCLVSNPKVIQQAHGDYYAAGAHVAITSSYQAHIGGFKELGLGEADALAAVQRSVQLARQASPPGGVVAGSVGSYGASLHDGAEYNGNFKGMGEAGLVDWHRPRVLALIEAGCDILACETLPSVAEARALVTLLREVKFPAWLTFACKSGTEIGSGELFSEAVAVAGACEYVVGVGVNCTHPSFVDSLVPICRAGLPEGRHVIVYPNSGEVWCGDTHSWKTGTATADASFCSMAERWRSLGASCIGGCCRTSPATIRGLAKAFSGQ